MEVELPCDGNRRADRADACAAELASAATHAASVEGDRRCGQSGAGEEQRERHGEARHQQQSLQQTRQVRRTSLEGLSHTRKVAAKRGPVERRSGCSKGQMFQYPVVLDEVEMDDQLEGVDAQRQATEIYDSLSRRRWRQRFNS